MSEENVEIVRKGFDVFNAFMRGELTGEAAAQPFDPQIEVHWAERRPFPDMREHLRGAPELIGSWEKFRSVLADVTWEPLEFIEAPDDRVLTPVGASFRGRESGVPVEHHFFLVWTIQDGRVRKADFFRHRTEALEAAGLSE